MVADLLKVKAVLEGKAPKVKQKEARPKQEVDIPF
jgi:hypothetical protein